MATYYVTSTGNAANPGTLASPWTLAKAFLSAVAGDVVYIAPGTYVGTFTASNAGSAGNAISFIGDPTASISWSGISAGVVRITNVVSDNALPTLANVLVGTSTHYLSFTNIFFEGYSTNALIIFTTSTNISFTQCAFTSIRTAAAPEYAVRITGTAGVAIAASMNRCIGNNVRCLLQMFAPTHSGAYSLNTTITNCLNVYGGVYWMDTNGGGTASNAGGITVYNCTALFDDCIRCYSNQTTFPSYVYNSILFAPNVCMLASTTGALVENYNRTFGQRFSVNTGVNTVTAGRLGFEFGQNLLAGLPSAQLFSSYIESPAVAGGTTSGAPLADMYGNLWSNTTPDNGSATYKPISGITAYIPTERNASAITIAPGSISQSIELYLGATGLTASTSGLTARYSRTRTASVSISLAARTIAQPWIAGGFAEVDPVGMPGVYRLDVPDEAFAIGADDVTITVRGASGTNGAVVTVSMKGVGSNIVHMGPYKVIADGLGADQPLDIMQGVQAPVSVQVVDVNENGIDITGATVQAKVYNSAGTLVGTYTCTPTYAADGRCTFLLTTDVTNVAGVYSITITRAVGGNVVVFGPLKVMVRAN
jgi:hypothetical protein